MVPLLIFGMLATLGIGFWLSHYDRRTAKAAGAGLEWTSGENMPRELMLASFVMSERSIETDYPIPLHGTPDQVFRTQAGIVVPIDTKTRSIVAVYYSDRLQLSVYAIILSYRYRLTVGQHGYVRVVLPNGSAHYCRTPLLGEREVVRAFRKLSYQKRN